MWNGNTFSTHSEIFFMLWEANDGRWYAADQPCHLSALLDTVEQAVSQIHDLRVYWITCHQICVTSLRLQDVVGSGTCIEFCAVSHLQPQMNSHENGKQDAQPFPSLIKVAVIAQCFTTTGFLDILYHILWPSIWQLLTRSCSKITKHQTCYIALKINRFGCEAAGVLFSVLYEISTTQLDSSEVFLILSLFGFVHYKKLFAHKLSYF